MSTPARTCPACHQPLPADAPQGLCPQCLAKSALGSQPGGEETVASGSKPGGSGPATIQPEIARLFPQLEIMEPLGQGGMGMVYKARQPQLDRIVALKVMRADLSRDPAFAERFAREARALAKLNHPNIVSVFDFGQSGGHCWILMEFVDGTNLRELLRTKTLQPREALGIVPKVCDALQYAHDEGIVHRDIKPENILLDKKGRVKIADFGLAKLVGKDASDFSLTATGMTLGTPRYMAPEQFDKPQEVDHRADIYSLGVVLYEMLTGEVPMGRFAPPSATIGVDVRLDEIVLRTLEKEPSRRYQHVSEVKTQVESVAGIVANLPPVPSATKATGATEPASGPKLLLDETDRSARQFQHLFLIGGQVWLLLGIVIVLIIPGKLPITAALWVGGIAMLFMASRHRQQWEVDYLGHVIRFENGIYTSGRLMIDGNIVASGGVGFHTELSGRIPRGSGAGHRIVVKTHAAIRFFRCQIFAGPNATAPGNEIQLGEQSLAAKPSGQPEFRQQDAREILALVMVVLTGLSVVGVIAGVIGLARVLFPALRMDMQLGPANSLGRDGFQFGSILVLSSMALFLLPKARRQGRDRLARINAVNLVIVGALLTFACSRHWFGLAVPYWLGGIYALVAFVCWILLRGQDVRAAFESVPITPPPAPSPRHLLSACLVVLCLFGFFFGLSFQAKHSGDAAGLTKLITIGALDPLYMSESGPSGFSTNLNFFSWSFFAVVVAGVAFGALWRIGREDQGKVPRDPAWWRNWWKQVGVWGGLLLIVCTIRTVMHPEKVLQPTSERTVASRFAKLFSTGPEIRMDLSQLPATKTPGRRDFAFTFTAPSNHVLHAWLEFWKDGKLEIPTSLSESYFPARGDSVRAGLHLTTQDGDMAGVGSAGQMRFDWALNRQARVVSDISKLSSSSTSHTGQWRTNLLKEHASRLSWDNQPAATVWRPKPGEVTTVLAWTAHAGKSVSSSDLDWTEDSLPKGLPAVAILLRVRYDPVAPGELSEAPMTKFAVINAKNRGPLPVKLTVGKQ